MTEISGGLVGGNGREGPRGWAEPGEVVGAGGGAADGGADMWNTVAG